MATLESLPECILSHIFSFIDTCDFKSVSLVSPSWCALSNTCVREISLNLNGRGIPATRKEVESFATRFKHIQTLKVRAESAADFARNGRSPYLSSNVFESKLDTLHVILLLVEAFKAELEFLELILLKEKLMKVLQTGFPKLRSLKLSSLSPSSSSTTVPLAQRVDATYHAPKEQDAVLKVFADSAYMEYFECDVYLESSVLKSLSNMQSFKRLRALVLGHTVLEEEIFSVLNGLNDLKYLRLGNVVSSSLQVDCSGLTSPLRSLRCLDITFSDGFFTDQSILSMSMLLPNLLKFRLGFKPVGTNFNYGYGGISDVGFKILAMKCPFLEILELNLPTDTRGEDFHLGFPNLSRLHLAHQGYLWTKETGWELSRKTIQII